MAKKKRTVGARKLRTNVVTLKLTDIEVETLFAASSRDMRPLSIWIRMAALKAAQS